MDSITNTIKFEEYYESKKRESLRPKNLTIVDADFLPFFVCHNKKNEPEKTLKDCIKLVDDFVFSILVNTNADEYTGFLTKGKCFRYQVNPDYKANRKYVDLPKYLDEIKQHIANKYNFTWQEGYEADDLCESVRNEYSKKAYNCTLVSPDKDLLNLEGINYNPRTNELIKIDKNQAYYSLWSSMLVGDSADNISGCKGIGPVGAKKILSAVEPDNYKSIVLNEYCKIYGEYKGILEFYKNYRCLYIVNDLEVINLQINKVEQ